MINDIKEKIFMTGLGLMMIIVMILIVLSLTSCISRPSKKDYVDQCSFDRDMCYYLNQKNPSVCADEAKECRAYGRYNFCKDSKNFAPGTMNEFQGFQGCWDKINSK